MAVHVDTNNNSESTYEQFEKKDYNFSIHPIRDRCLLKREQNLSESIFTKSKLTCKITPVLFTLFKPLTSIDALRVSFSRH